VSFQIDDAIREHGPEQIMRALEPFVSDARRARFEAVLAARLSSLTVVLEDLYDAHNGAAAIRSIEAFGLSEVHAIEGANPFRYSTGITMGCERWLDIHRYTDIESCAATLKQRGMVLTATLPDADATLEDLDGGKPRALIFGNEHEGVSPRALELCDELVRIPMFGFTESFNLSVSVALTLQWAAARRRHALGAAGDLKEEKKQWLRARWYAVGVRGAAGIIERYVAGQTQ